jgi:aconitate hydratase
MVFNELGILPLVFVDEKDYDGIEQGDSLKIQDVLRNVAGEQIFRVENESKGTSFLVRLDASPRLREILLAGGLLNYTRKNSEKGC